MSEQPLASSRVELSIDFDDLDEELQRDLKKRMQRVAKDAEKTLDKIPQASRKAGKAVADDLGNGADRAAAKVKRAAAAIEGALDDAAEAGGRVGDEVADGADRAAASLRRLSQAGQGSLFDIDESGGFVEVRQQIEAVQGALFDLDTVEIDRVEQVADRAATTLRGRLVPAAEQASDAIASIGGRGGGGAGLDDLGDQVADFGKKADRSGVSLNKYTGRLGLLASAIAFAAGAAPLLVAAGAGIAATAALAVGPIRDVIKGTTDLADRWDGLTRAQRQAVVSTRQLITQYKAVSAAVEPSTLRLYNAAVSETIRLLPRLRPLAETTSEALIRSTQTIGQGFDSPRAREFFAFLERSAGPAVDALTDLMLDLGAALASTVEALAPLGGSVVGLVGVLLRLLTVLNDVSPVLAQLVVTAIALRTPLAAASGLLGSGAKKVAGFATSAGKAAGAARLLNVVAGAGPNLYVAAGIAIAFFAIKALNAKSAIDSTINSINGINNATGNNIKGYEAANKALSAKLIPAQQRLAAASREVTRDASQMNLQMLQGALAANDFVQVPIEAAMARNSEAIKRVTSAAQQLVNAGFAPSIESATRLATAAGVDLSKALDENGTISASAAARIATYSASVATAKDTTIVLADAWSRAKDEALGLTLQTQALQEAFDRFLNPSLAVLDATNRLKEVQNEINAAFKKGNLTSLQRQQFLSKEVTALRDKLVAEQRAKGSTAETTAETLKLLPALSRLAGNSKAGQAAVFALARSLDGAREDAKGAITVVDRLGNRIKVLPNGKVIKLKAVADTSPAESAVQRLIKNSSGKVIDVFVRVNGGLQAHAGATGGRFDAVRGFQRFAGGGGISGRLSGPGTGTSDSILARLSNGEFVVNAAATKRHERLLQAINSNRFASGGLVGALPRFALGGPVQRAPKVDISALLGAALAAGLTGNRRALAAELERQRKNLEKRILAIAQTVGVGFVKNITGSPSEIGRAFTSLERQISRAFSGIKTKVDDLLIKRLEVLNGRLSTLAKQRDKITAAIENAQQLATSTTDQARTFAGLSGFSDDERASGASIEKTLRDRLAKIRQFARDIQALAGRGLSKSLLRQIIEGGPEEGGALAATLRKTSKTALFQINKTQAQIDAATRNLGRDSADLLFDAGRQASKGFLTGLQADRKKIIALMTEIAESVSLTVRKTLKIKSPSRVLDKDAENTMLGYIRGLQRLRARVQAEIADTVRPDRQVERAAALLPPRASALTGGRGAAATTGTARSTTINQTNNINNVTDPRAVVDIIEGRLVAALR
ncbi:hypothetical protein AB0F17_28805 [Nonomuraea sp. NPDC026600]|uniref:hypothetical protein n=1 Tax=Nonomuraea sp. NPDC026600 TaxID=3155363 RepID=UPI00340114DE